MIGLLEAAALVALSAGDYAVTMQNLRSPGGYETNPIARPFVSRGPVAGAAYFTVMVGGDLFIIEKLRSKHGKLSRVLYWSSVVGESASIVYSVERRGERK